MRDLSVFFPWSLYELAGDALAGRPAWKQAEGGVLFCDVAGFTPLTEALSVLGKEGAEELTRLLNDYFTRMIGIVEEEGGDVLRFGGDAMTVFFPGADAVAAFRAACRMMGRMEDFEAIPTRAGTFRLSMKIGVAWGLVQMGFLGDRSTGYDFYAAGLPVDESAAAEHHATPGDIVVHPSARPMLPGRAPLRPLGGGFSRVDGPLDPDASAVAHRIAGTPERLSEMVPDYLAERAGGGTLGEHRGTAVLFLGFREPEPSASEGEGRHSCLDIVYRTLADIARRYGGILNKVDLGDKGCKALLLFGSPYALEHREEMAVRTATDILSPGSLPEGVSVRMGVTSAQLFSGPVGSPSRREFTVMGDGINLAARLMQACEEGGALCDRAVAKGASEAFLFKTLEPIHVKGKKDPVEIFAPAGRRAREPQAARRMALVEREGPCAALARALFAPEGRPLALAGEAGSGKSALVEWAREQAKLRELPVTRAILAPFSADRPYGAWRGCVRSAVGLQKEDSSERARTLREIALAGEPAGYRPLLNVFLDLPEEMTPAIRTLAAKERKDLTFAMVARLLGGSGERVILIDNLQWADPLSIDLLSFLLQEAAVAPWRLAASFRPGSEGAERVAASMERVILAPLSREGVRTVLKETHRLLDVAPEVLEWFVSRSRGNPALVAALMTALETAGLASVDSLGGLRIDADRLFATDFPDTLEGLYLARVDRLPRKERELLQAASILGVSISQNLLDRVARLHKEELDSGLEALRSEGFLRQDSWGARPYWKFEDPLLRDAVYASLPYALRREGHLAVAETLEPEAQPRLWAILAQHFEQAGEEQKAKRYHRSAGRDAAGRFDNLTALRHLEASCGILAADREDLEDAFSLLDIYTFLGRKENFQQLLARLGTIEADMHTPHRARLLQFKARDSWQGQRWEEAEQRLMGAKDLYEKIGDTDGIGKCYVNLVGGIYGPTGRLEEARGCLEKALALPEEAGQSVWRTMAAMNLGAVSKHLGEPDLAQSLFQKAYQLAVRGRLGPQRGMVSGNLCGLLLERGHFAEAAVWGKRAVSVLDRFAIRGVLLNAQYNLAAAHLSTGNASSVRENLGKVLLSAERQRNLHVTAMAHQGLIQAALATGDLQAALDHAETAMRLFRTLDNGRDFRFSLASALPLFYSLGCHQEAGQFLAKTGAEEYLSQSPGDPLLDKTLQRFGAWIRMDKGALSSPEAFVDEAGSDFPEERLERILWLCEIAVGVDSAEDKRALLDRARGALAAWPYFDARLRVMRLELLSQGHLPASRSKEARYLLGRCLGGVFGLRLLCLLWGQERQPQRKSTLRLQGLRHLYFLQSRSPSWAWARVAHFPEVLALLKGP